MKRALCLQGGGAKGAFQAGAIKALKERGYKFNCAVGASVGCLNAAMVAQGKIDELYSLWENLDLTDVLPVDRIAEGGRLSFRSVASSALNILTQGVDTSRIRAILEKNVDEDALRSSKINFGLVTVEGGKEKNLKKLFINDIPRGKLIDFMMASAALPLFKKVEIEGTRYWDGGMIDNLPLSMLVEKGYENITAIRLGGNLSYKPKQGEKVKIEYIDPTFSAGQLINFSSAALNRSLRMGYFDALRHLDSLTGKTYYLKSFAMRDLAKTLARTGDFINKALLSFGISIGGDDKEKLAMLTLLLGQIFGMTNRAADRIWIRFFETFAEFYGVERWKVYSLEEFLRETAIAFDPAKPTKGDEKQMKAAAVFRTFAEEMKK